MATVYVVTEDADEGNGATIHKVFSTPEKADDYLMGLTELDRVFHQVEIWDVE